MITDTIANRILPLLGEVEKGEYAYGALLYTLYTPEQAQAELNLVLTVVFVVALTLLFSVIAITALLNFLARQF